MQLMNFPQGCQHLLLINTHQLRMHQFQNSKDFSHPLISLDVWAT